MRKLYKTVNQSYKLLNNIMIHIIYLTIKDACNKLEQMNYQNWYFTLSIREIIVMCTCKRYEKMFLFTRLTISPFELNPT